MFVGTLLWPSFTLKVQVPVATGAIVNDCKPFASGASEVTEAIVTMPDEMHEAGAVMFCVDPLSLAVTVWAKAPLDANVSVAGVSETGTIG